ncbi:unnamed protein product [Calypogeia fissa]
MGKQMVKAVALGQFLSLLITGTAFSSSELVRNGIDAPTSQSFFNYVLLAAVNGIYLLRRKKPLKVKWYLYLLLAVIDVEANYLATKAYQYTSITSVMLLDCWTIPCVLLLTWFLLSTRYLRGHFIGVSLCVLGLGLVLLSDVHAGDRSGGSNFLLGDTLVLVAATMYAVTNVYEEFLVRQVDRVELLAMYGGFGAIVCACQVFVLERRELAAIHWSASAILPFVSFAGCLFLFSTLLPLLLQIGGSTMLNLSLLTSDMYAIAIRMVLYHQSVDWIYFVAFATVASGITYYSLSGEPSNSEVGSEDLPSKGIGYERVETSTDLAQELSVSTPEVP